VDFGGGPWSSNSDTKPRIPNDNCNAEKCSSFGLRQVSENDCISGTVRLSALGAFGYFRVANLP
jgi:hypothetical protein